MPVWVDPAYADAVAAETIARLVIRKQLEKRREAERDVLASRPAPSITAWAERRFYIPETRRPIRFTPFQRAILEHVFQKDARGRLPYTTVVWSQPKKSGKTAIAGVVARYFAETQSSYGEVYCLANDFEQAQGRIYKAAKKSIELDPSFDREKRTLPGEWRVLDKHMDHLPTGSVISANASEYKSEAGGNPSITLWSELWGFLQESSRRLWEEMTPVPTRPNSMRWVETYAGFEGESDLLNDLMDSGLAGRQLTAADLGQREGEPAIFEESPNPSDLIPCWVNDAARLFMFYDTGDTGHRQPWQRGELGDAYYREELATMRPLAYRRLHLNERVSAESAFIPIEWWDNCQVNELTPLGRTPVVIALDAGVSSDTFAIIAVSRHPERPKDLALRGAWKFTPPPGGTVDFGKVEAGLRARHAEWNIVQVCYDPYQLHEMAMRLSSDLGLWFYEFSQGSPRLVADKQLADLIRDRRIAHLGHPDLREHLVNAAAKTSKDDDSKLRIIKKSQNSKIDLAVALSMACHEALRLNI